MEYAYHGVYTHKGQYGSMTVWLRNPNDQITGDDMETAKTQIQTAVGEGDVVVTNLIALPGDNRRG